MPCTHKTVEIPISTERGTATLVSCNECEQRWWEWDGAPVARPRAHRRLGAAYRGARRSSSTADAPLARPA